MREDLGAYAGGHGAQLRILSNTNALTEFLPEALSAYLASNPKISVDLEERLSDEIVGLVAEGAAEIGIVAGTVDTGSLETYPFRSDQFVVVVARDHRFATLPAVGFADVLDEDFVGLDRASALQRFLAGRAARLGRTIRLRVQLRSFDAVCRLVESGVGIGIVPETTARRAVRSAEIAIIHLRDAWAVRDLTICVRTLAGLSPQAHGLVAHLRKPPAPGPAAKA